LVTGADTGAGSGFETTALVLDEVLVLLKIIESIIDPTIEITQPVPLGS
jgi:hypothetical protein